MKPEAEVKMSTSYILPAFLCKDVNDLIRYYHGTQFSYREICSLINTHHGLPLTTRQLQYICKKENLSRRTSITDGDVEKIILNELTTSRSCIGYRQMTEMVNLKYGLNISRERTRIILKRVDPLAVMERSRKVINRRIYETNGPNEIYHIDGNDKLKRWGFCIHGAVDGFSRKLLWITVATTNNDPLVIANFFLACIRTHGIAPKLLRMDKGTENIFCEDLQVYFTGNINSFRCAASTRNQRIEAYWCHGLKSFVLIGGLNFLRECFGKVCISHI